MFAHLISNETLQKTKRWDELKRWERREIGQELRRMGLCYREIRSVIPVSKGTLSLWCRDIELTAEQLAVLESTRIRQFQRTGVGQMLRKRSLERSEGIRTSARNEALKLSSDPDWMAGTVAYWAEGTKRHKDVVFANSDPAIVNLFMKWACRYLDLSTDRFTARLHLHDGQDEAERRQFWSDAIGIPESAFRKTFIKPEGTGHRKNILYNGTIQVRVTRSTDLLHRVKGWIDAVAEHYTDLSYTSAGR